LTEEVTINCNLRASLKAWHTRESDGRFNGAWLSVLARDSQAAG
jgi:hypothetical protein